MIEIFSLQAREFLRQDGVKGKMSKEQKLVKVYIHTK